MTATTNDKELFEVLNGDAFPSPPECEGVWEQNHSETEQQKRHTQKLAAILAFHKLREVDYDANGKPIQF